VLSYEVVENEMYLRFCSKKILPLIFFKAVTTFRKRKVGQLPRLDGWGLFREEQEQLVD
jgi:hypothetical protein